MLLAVQELAPALYPFVHSSYSSPSSLFWHDSALQSAEGVQQGDPLGPLLFCVSIHDLCSQLISEFNVWHLDDSSVGGTLDDVRHDLEIVQRFGSKLGLHLSHQKSEVVWTKFVAVNLTLSAIPGAQVVDPASATLLGSPIRDTASITSVINDKIHHLTIMGERLQHLTMQNALLLRNSYLTHRILPPCCQLKELPWVEEATKRWSKDLDLPPPSDPASHHQKTWDAHRVSATADTLLKQAPNAVTCFHLLAASAKESGAWLNALPISSLGLCMDNNTVRVAVGLHLGSTRCQPHTCHYCGVQIDGSATQWPQLQME